VPLRWATDPSSWKDEGVNITAAFKPLPPLEPDFRKALAQANGQLAAVLRDIHWRQPLATIMAARPQPTQFDPQQHAQLSWSRVMDVKKTLTIRDIEQLSHPGAWLMDTIWTECSARGRTRTTIAPSAQLKPWPNDNYHAVAHHAGMPSTHAESAVTVGNRYETLATLLIATQQWDSS
jgi:hypothetical protein